MAELLFRYFLTLTSVQPLYGKLSDVFGRKSSLLFAYAVFGLGCLFCGLARNMNELIAARAFAGIGGGGMTTVVSILLSDIVPLRERGTWQGLTNVIYTIGSASGAPLGGLIADYLNWRWGFLMQVPLCALAFASVSFVLKLPSKDVSGWRAKIRRLDFLGAFALVAAVLSLIFGLDRGANKAWQSLTAILPVCLSVPLFALFILIEVKLANEPFAPKHIIFDRSLLAAYLCNFFASGGWLSTLFYLPLYYQAVDYTSASQAGLRLLPGIITGVIGSLSGGFLMQKTGKYYLLTLIGYAVFAIAFVPVILCSGTLVNSLWGISVGLFVMGLGAGVGITTTLISIIANASSQDQAVATACTYLFRSLGSVIGLSLSATIVQQSLKTLLRIRLKGNRDVDSIERHVRESLEFINTLEPNLQEIVRQCYGTAIRNGFVFMMILVVFGVISGRKLEFRKARQISPTDELREQSSSEKRS